MMVEPDNTPSRENISLAKPPASVDSLAAAAVFNVISRGAVVIVAGILVWGFNKIDRSLEEMNSTLGKVQLAIGRLETERDNIRERINALDMRLGDAERSFRR